MTLNSRLYDKIGGTEYIIISVRSRGISEGKGDLSACVTAYCRRGEGSGKKTRGKGKERKERKEKEGRGGESKHNRKEVNNEGRKRTAERKE